ncbi:MAG TPA: pyridoxamine 5'-phosphate oxidase [Dehalococcoidia bacterium]|nr:pyridoxamine 5'-phosphate oxidase [Dehalococcoidia bacterium]
MLPTDDPIDLYRTWLAEATSSEPDLAEAANLATASAEGRPSSRLVLVQLREDGDFEFHTNRQSRKGREMAENPHVALTWHWKSLGRQVRVEGVAALLSDEQSDAYWNERARGSQISASISQQSEPVDSREELDRRRADLDASAGYFPVARPSHWGGYLVRPDLIEFWIHRDDRLHDRLQFRRTETAGEWLATRLQP